MLKSVLLCTRIGIVSDEMVLCIKVSMIFYTKVLDGKSSLLKFQSFMACTFVVDRESRSQGKRAIEGRSQKDTPIGK